MGIDMIIAVVTALGGWELIKYLLTLRSQRRLSNSEADKAEQEVESERVEVWKGMQDVYQQTIDDQKRFYNDLLQDRNEQREENNALRRRINQMDEKVIALERDVARNGRMVEALRPFVCYKTDCMDRQRTDLGKRKTRKAEEKGEKV
jgi:hypothetical protein